MVGAPAATNQGPGDLPALNGYLLIGSTTNDGAA